MTLALLLAVCSFGPGFFAVRRLRWSPTEKLCGGIGLSLVFVYLAAWTIYCSGLQNQRAVFWICSVVAAVLTIASARDIAALLRSARVRRSVAGFAFLLLWNVTVVAMIRSYSGGGWYLDWLEHFQRTLFFLHRFPAGTPIGRIYTLPARPPMMNVLAAFFLGQTADSYASFQIVVTWLNTLLVFPCALILPALGGARKGTMLPLVALFALNPMIVENATYAWTKLLTAFFVVLAVALFLAAWRKRETTRMVAAFVSLSAAGVVHYSAGPYIVVITIFYFVVVFRTRPRKWHELAFIALACACLLGTWFAWSANAYGLGTTLTSNTTMSGSASRHGGNISKAVQNLVSSTLPFWLASPRGRAFASTVAGQLRDAAFLLYQQNLVFGMGLVGGIVAAWTFLFRLRGARERLFWRVFVIACIAIGMLVSSAVSRYGAAHETLIAVEVLGVTWLASLFPTRRGIAIALIAGSVVDFSLGIALQAKMQNLENGAGRTPFTAVASEESVVAPDASVPMLVSAGAWANWRLKHRFELDRELLAQPHSARLQSLLEDDLADDARAWQGWWSRHDWKIRFIGDEIGAPAIPLTVLLVLAVALLAVLTRSALRIATESGSLIRSRPRSPRATEESASRSLRRSRSYAGR